MFHYYIQSLGYRYVSILDMEFQYEILTKFYRFLVLNNIVSGCTMYGFLTGLSGTCSIMSLTAVSVEIR